MDFWNTFGPGAVENFLGYQDPSKDAMKYYQQIPQQVSQYFNPYIQAGQSQLPGLQKQFGDITSDPGAFMNKIGAGYQKSPGFDFAMKQALGAAGRSAAAGGMAGSPMHQQESMDIASNLANRDYGNWLDRTLGLYGRGLGGEESLAGMGYGASKSMADSIAQALAQQGQLKYAGNASQNQGIGGLLGDIGSLAAFL